MVRQLLDQLAKHATSIDKLIITYNVEETEWVIPEKYPFKVILIRNPEPLGFGSNHNQAFHYCETDYFCVMNPDIYIQNDPFEQLLSCFLVQSVSVVAPSIIDADGRKEDSARYFPTPICLIKKLLLKYDGVFPFAEKDRVVFPDWVGGMFLLFSAEKYKFLSGFDEKYFLYYEDVDICARIWKAGYSVVLNTEVNVVHNARRESHIKLKFLRWHLVSAFRFFLNHYGRFPEKII